jgi:hypothetical protein
MSREQKGPTLIDFREDNNAGELRMRIAGYGRVEDVDSLTNQFSMIRNSESRVASSYASSRCPRLWLAHL